MKKLALSLAICGFATCLYGQRHYSGVSALEATYGTNIFGHKQAMSLSYSKYKSRTAYWKIGVEYAEKSAKYKLETPISLEGTVGIQRITGERYYRDYCLEGNYFKTVTTNLTSLYFNLGIGAFTGVEAYKQDENKYKWLIGPKIGAELEYFVASRFGFVGRVTQDWNPFSKRRWNTEALAGIKVLL